MIVILGHVVGHPAEARVDVRAAQLLGGHVLAGGRLDQRRAAQEDGAGAFDDDGLVAHGGNIGAARRAAAHHRGDLRDLFGGHARLVVEDAPEVPHVREDLVLQRQKGPARIDQIQAGQAVLLGDLLGAQVFLDRQREIGAALDGGVVGDDEHLPARDAPDAGDDARRGAFPVVEVPGGQRRQFEEGGAGVEQPLDALAHEQFALRLVALAVFFAAALRDERQTLLQFRGQRAVVLRVGAELRRGRIEMGGKNFHG